MWIAIDLAITKPLAYCGIAGEEIIFVKSTHRKGEAGLVEIFGLIKDARKYEYQIIEGIVTERPYHKLNQEIFRHFAEIVGRIRHFCDKNELEFAQIMPAHWKGAYLKGHYPAATKAGNAMLNKIAKSILGRNNFTPDERDAVLFGLYHIRRLKKIGGKK